MTMQDEIWPSGLFAYCDCLLGFVRLVASRSLQIRITTSRHVQSSALRVGLDVLGMDLRTLGVDLIALKVDPGSLGVNLGALGVDLGDRMQWLRWFLRLKRFRWTDHWNEMCRPAKEASKAQLETKLQETKEQKALTVESLEDISLTVNHLHTSCDFIMENYDTRKEARSNESESLKNSKSVLSGADFR